MRRTPSRAVRLAVEATKVVVVCTISYLAVTPALVQAQNVTADQAAPTPADVAASERLSTLMDRHDCSATGLGADVIPGSALVERDDRVQQVSFDDGWAVFTGDADGSLLAVCRGALDAPGSTRAG
jgi:hypothetical protein